MARLSLFMLAVTIEISRGYRGESDNEQEAAQLAFDQDAENAENPYYSKKPGWEDTVVDEVTKLLSVGLKMRQNFAPVKHWTEVAGLSMHMMIATTMLENLKTATHVVDIGSGTGALLAVFAELVPKSAVVEGLEYMMNVALASKKKMADACLLFKEADKEDAQMVANKTLTTGIKGGELDGNLFTFNLNGDRDGEFDVINVGFAMNENEIPGVLWKAVAVNGKLGMPICDEMSENNGKCACHYHIFTKTEENKAVFPGTKSQGSEHTKIEKDINFILVRPPTKHVQVQEGYERVECPERKDKLPTGPSSPCHKFSEEVPLPIEGAAFFKKVLSDDWTKNVTTKDFGYYKTAHREDTVWAGGAEHPAWGLQVIYDLDCEQTISDLTWQFSGFGDLNDMGTRTIRNIGDFGDCN